MFDELFNGSVVVAIFVWSSSADVDDSCFFVLLPPNKIKRKMTAITMAVIR